MGEPLSFVGFMVKRISWTLAVGNNDGGSGGDAKERAEDASAELQLLQPTSLQHRAR
jgi:hypothetical protein